MQNTSMFGRIKIENIFWLFILKKNKRTLPLVTKIDKTKMTNILIEEDLVLDQNLHRYMRYNLGYRI